MEKNQSEKDYIFGIRAVIETVRAGKEIDKVLIARKSESSISRDLLNLLKEYGIPTQYIPIEKINKITRKNHQGVLAFIAAVSYVPIEELVNQSYEQGRDPLFVLLDRVSDVRNFGAIARSAECLGFNGVVIPFKGAAKINADAVKTSAGALMKIGVSRVSSLKNSIKYLKDCGIKIVAITEKATEICYKEDLSGPMALILGSEDTGISDDILHLADKAIMIPMYGQTESLNVSVAASIAMYEVSRQRNL